MQQLTDLQHLRRDLVTGNRLKFNAALTSLILDQVEREVDAELKWQNHLIFCNSVQGTNMREVHNLATGMKEAIASIKKAAVDARAQLDSEVARAQTNVGKVKSVATALKEANLEVESFLGETGSNFPSSETSPMSAGHADINGVTVNPEAKK